MPYCCSFGDAFMSQTKNAVWYESFESDSKTSSLKKSVDAGTIVRIQDYNPTYHTLKVVRESDGKPIRPNRTTQKKIENGKLFEQPNTKVLKTLSAPDAPIIEVNDEEASIRGSSGYGFFSSRQFGNILKGPVSFSAQPHEVRIGGLMTLHPLLTSGFPSTIVTPIPTLQWSLPTASMLGPIAKDVALISTLVGVIA